MKPRASVAESNLATALDGKLFKHSNVFNQNIHQPGFKKMQVDSNIKKKREGRAEALYPTPPKPNKHEKILNKRQKEKQSSLPTKRHGRNAEAHKERQSEEEDGFAYRNASLEPTERERDEEDGFALPQRVAEAHEQVQPRGVEGDGERLLGEGLQQVETAFGVVPHAHAAIQTARDDQRFAHAHVHA